MRTNCDHVADDNLAERYLLGRLSPAERDAYERHYFECDRCFGELRRLQVIQEALRNPRDGSPAATREPQRWRQWRGPMVGALAASLVAALLVFRPFDSTERVADVEKVPAVEASTEVPTSPVDGSSEPPSETNAGGTADLSAAAAKAPSRRAQLLERLARADPPRYSPNVLRGAVVDDATSAFRDGMQRYGARDFGAAVPHLRTAARLDPSRPDFAFFLAASEFLSGDVTSAAADFERTIGMGDTPFLEEAHFYLAKVHLKQGEVGSARSELSAVIQIQGELRAEAEAILAQLESVDAGR